MIAVVRRSASGALFDAGRTEERSTCTDIGRHIITNARASDDDDMMMTDGRMVHLHKKKGYQYRAGCCVMDGLSIPCWLLCYGWANFEVWSLR